MHLTVPTLVDQLCIWVIVLTTIYSGVEYFIKNKDCCMVFILSLSPFNQKRPSCLSHERRQYAVQSVMEIAQFYTDAFFADCAKLNVNPPDVVQPATGMIPEYIQVIAKLLDSEGPDILRNISWRCRSTRCASPDSPLPRENPI